VIFGSRCHRVRVPCSRSLTAPCGSLSASALLTLRDELRAAVAELDVPEGRVLRGTFAGSLPSGADVENRVLLNIRLPQRCLRHGFAFEHDVELPPGWTCGYRYCAVNPEQPLDYWRPRVLLAAWQNAPLAHGLTAPAIWWTLRTRRDPGVEGPAAAAGGILLMAIVTSRQALSLNQIKAVADGLVAAAQWTRIVDPGGIDRLSANLTRAGIPADRATVFNLLRDASGAGAGHCQDGLIARDGRVNPDDHLVVAGLVHVRTTTAAPTLTAVIYGAEPVSARPSTS
jgi:hypothetical protein